MHENLQRYGNYLVQSINQSIMPYNNQADWKEGFKKKELGVADMTLLTTISNESINDNLEKRWKHGDIYTYIGPVLISVNPFKGEQVHEFIDTYGLMCYLNKISGSIQKMCCRNTRGRTSLKSHPMFLV